MALPAAGRGAGRVRHRPSRLPGPLFSMPNRYGAAGPAPCRREPVSRAVAWDSAACTCPGGPGGARAQCCSATLTDGHADPHWFRQTQNVPRSSHGGGVLPAHRRGRFRPAEDPPRREWRVDTVLKDAACHRQRGSWERRAQRGLSFQVERENKYHRSRPGGRGGVENQVGRQDGSPVGLGRDSGSSGLQHAPSRPRRGEIVGAEPWSAFREDGAVGGGSAE